jgi:hypothetical protein
MLGNRNHIEASVRFDVLEDALYGIEAVAVAGVDVKVSFAHVWGHFSL